MDRLELVYISISFTFTRLSMVQLYSKGSYVNIIKTCFMAESSYFTTRLRGSGERKVSYFLVLHSNTSIRVYLASYQSKHSISLLFCSVVSIQIQKKREKFDLFLVVFNFTRTKSLGFSATVQKKQAILELRRLCEISLSTCC